MTPEGAAPTKLLAIQAARICKDIGQEYETILELAESAEKMRAVSTMDYVNGMPQNASSKASFASFARQKESQIPRHLSRLRELTTIGNGIWRNFLRNAGGETGDFVRAMNWCMENGVPHDIIDTLATESFFLVADFGLTMESFDAENERVNAALSGGSSDSRDYSNQR